MASSRKHHRRRGKRTYRKHRGGYAANYPEIYPTEGAGQLPAAANPSGYNDSGSWMLKTVGNVNTQYDNAFNQSTGTSSNGAIVGLQGQVAGRKRSHRHTRRLRGGSSSSSPNPHPTTIPPSTSASVSNIASNIVKGVLPVTKGGKRTRKHSKGMKGGYWSGILSRALVPLSILGLQQSFKKRSRK
jgi:hypothetical protein